MPLERRKVVSGLKKKGFEEISGHHKFLTYRLSGTKKAIARTRVSHGSRKKTLPNGIVKAMAQQCHLSVSEFEGLVECTLSQDDYEKILRGNDKLWPKAAK